ncbi:hypothetical protein P148_SR1C00001G0604 [candidate division SR1 bacterium RAAC1_SR1_1]|nr:hypothetical protein P148_SR1C00001G0604 [candidate division SR1 bacterium RAAC1_SR1_1]
MEKEPSTLQQEINTLITKIEQEFDGVTLGNGIGITEAIAVDEWLDENDKERKKSRVSDERNDRKKYICKREPEENSFDHWRCFSDIEGRRFLLPAYMISRLKNFYFADDGIVLTNFENEEWINEENPHNEKLDSMIKELKELSNVDKYKSMKKEAYNEMIKESEKLIKEIEKERNIEIKDPKKDFEKLFSAVLTPAQKKTILDFLSLQIKIANTQEVAGEQVEEKENFIKLTEKKIKLVKNFIE